jgi:hypothetical protein
MFCTNCGTPFTAGAQFCSSCGKALAPSPSAPIRSASTRPTGNRVQRHIQLLSGLWLANGILRLMEVAWIMIAGRIFVFPFFRGAVGPWGNWGFDSFLARGIYAAGLMFAVFGIAHLALAWGLHERQPWARLLGIVIAFLALFRVPFGTALGIYTLWVLLPESSGREYDAMSAASGQFHAAGSSF